MFTGGGAQIAAVPRDSTELSHLRDSLFSDFPGGHGVGDLELPFEIVSGQRSWAAGPVSTSSSGASEKMTLITQWSWRQQHSHGLLQPP